MSYRDYQVQITPTALRAPYGVSWSRGLGIVKDYYTQLTKQGTKLRFPDFASPDALGAIGDEREITQGIDVLTGANESAAAYALRLKNAWAKDAVRNAPPDTANSIWYWGGTAFGMLRAFESLGYGQNAIIIQQSGLYWELDISGNLVVTQHAPLMGWPFWNSFLVLFSPTPASWTSPASPATPLTIPDDNEINRLTNLILTRKPAHALCLGLQINVSGRVWGYPPAPVAGHPVWGTGTWGGTIIRWPVPNAVSP